MIILFGLKKKKKEEKKGTGYSTQYLTCKAAQHFISNCTYHDFLFFAVKHDSYLDRLCVLCQN